MLFRLLLPAVVLVLSLSSNLVAQQSASEMTSTIDTLEDRVANLERTQKLERDSRAQQLANLQSLNQQMQSQLEEKAKQFNEEQQVSEVLRRKLEEANRRIAKQAAELAELKKDKKKTAGEPKKAEPLQPAPKVESVVTAVGKDGDKFAIMVGLDNGLRKGHEMDVYRNNRFIGIGKVIAAENNRSILSTVKETMNDKVREGDQVTTKL